ncbi:MAG: M15 family metallopeptidase [Pseudomonadota bacterium]
MEKGVIPIILGVMGVIVVGLGVLVYLQLRPTPEVPRYASDGDAEFAGPAIDSGARIEIEVLRAQIEALGVQIERLEQRISENQAPTSTAPIDGSQPQFVPGDGIDNYAQVVLIAARRNLNEGLRIASPSYLESVFGKPRDNLTSTCQGMTNERLASKLRTEQVGPVRVRMLQPALDSLGRVFDEIQKTDPKLYSRINTAGALCVRHIRGAPGRTSTHAFGLSLDLNIDGKLDRLGDGKTQLGLTILADFFQAEGWYWGAAFSREDSMHFEVSRDLVEKWIAEGLL